MRRRPKLPPFPVIVGRLEKIFEPPCVEHDTILELCGDARRAGWDMSDWFLMMAEADAPDSNPYALAILMMDGTPENEARRKLMRKMSDSAARGETTFVGVCTRLSTVRKQDMSDLPETHRAFLELELPPGYVHLVIWDDHGVAYRGVGIPDGATQLPGR